MNHGIDYRFADGFFVEGVTIKDGREIVYMQQRIASWLVDISPYFVNGQK